MSNLDATLGTVVSQLVGAAMNATPVNNKRYAFQKDVTMPASLATDLGVVAANWTLKVIVVVNGNDRTIKVTLRGRKMT